MKMKIRFSKKRYILPFLALTSLLSLKVSSIGKKTTGVVKHTVAKAAVSAKAMLYDQLALGSLGLSQQAYQYALEGYERLLEEGKLKNDEILSIVDFSLPSSKKRLFVIDLASGKLLFNSLVSHGRNSGKDMATNFSNSQESFQSSLGFYVTGGTYKGKHGYSLKLEGEEDGINSNAMERGIVMHAASYVDEKLARLQGYIGRSLGCPAVPVKLHKKIISKIQNGTCLFMYSPDQKYIAASRMLQHAA
ncbi:murein L,D-transpeptidase catalytic domain family protein [Chitinophaga sp. SYP-B3965]|uniref:murein L,D-transpeptidase catalytic domain family protein n=1 Tax=Chitinophaga sp. SYP-B3965 TaxID=2663120 RepID=UPI0020A6B245|nr:murein L,D-transpeptidase catalytic domain family protein [Chitinophaga sp. SYP-B3965]